MLKHLRNESMRLGKRRISMELLKQFGPYFETGMYEKAGIVRENEADKQSDNSSNSYESGHGHLYSENNESNAEEEKVEFESSLRKQNKESFMKAVEKKLVHGQGFKGFSSLKK